jgi:hypothetical protein
MAWHNSTDIPGFTDEFKGYILQATGLSEKEDPDSICSKGVIAPFNQTCTTALNAILHRSRIAVPFLVDACSDPIFSTKPWTG